MDKSILEAEIEKWAKEKGYPVTDRRFYNQLEAEADVGKSLGLDEKDERFLECIRSMAVVPIVPGSQRDEEQRKIILENKYGNHDDLVFGVLTPTGILVYEASFRKGIQGIPNEDSYSQHLRQVSGLPEESISLYHGPRIIPCWKSKQIPLETRKDDQDGVSFYLDLSEGSESFKVRLDEDGKMNVLHLYGDDARQLPVMIRLAPFISKYDGETPVLRNSQGYRELLEAYSTLFDSPPSPLGFK